MAGLIRKNCAPNDYTLTPKALKRLRLVTAIALIGFPSFCIIEMLGLLDSTPKALHLFITTLLLMSAIPLSSDRIFYRLSHLHCRLDERERETVIKAKAFSYKIVLIGFALTAALSVLALWVSGAEARAPLVNPATAILLVMNVMFFMVFLPITHIAWTQKPILDE